MKNKTSMNSTLGSLWHNLRNFWILISSNLTQFSQTSAEFIYFDNWAFSSIPKSYTISLQTQYISAFVYFELEITLKFKLEKCPGRELRDKSTLSKILTI